MYEDAVNLHHTVEQAHQQAYCLLQGLKASTKADVPDLSQLTDTLHALRASKKYLEDLVKEINAMDSIVVRVFCTMWAQMESPPEHVKTEYATAYNVRVKMMTPIPRRSKNPENYRKLMEHFGVPSHLWDVSQDEEPVVSLHWPGMTSYISHLTEQGKPLPPGMEGALFPVYAVSIRGRKEF